MSLEAAQSTPQVNPPSIFLIEIMHVTIQYASKDVGTKIGYVIALILFVIPILLVDGLVALGRHFSTSILINSGVKDAIQQQVIAILTNDTIITHINNKVMEVLRNILSNDELIDNLHQRMLGIANSPATSEALKTLINSIITSQDVRDNVSTMVREVAGSVLTPAVAGMLVKPHVVSEEAISELAPAVFESFVKEVKLLEEKFKDEEISMWKNTTTGLILKTTIIVNKGSPTDFIEKAFNESKDLVSSLSSMINNGSVSVFINKIRNLGVSSLFCYDLEKIIVNLMQDHLKKGVTLEVQKPNKHLQKKIAGREKTRAEKEAQATGGGGGAGVPLEEVALVVDSSQAVALEEGGGGGKPDTPPASST